MCLKVPRVGFDKVVAHGTPPRYIDKSIISKKPRMVLPVPGRVMVKREEKKSPWASLGAVIALTAYIIKFPNDI